MPSIEALDGTSKAAARAHGRAPDETGASASPRSPSLEVREDVEGAGPGPGGPDEPLARVEDGPAPHPAGAVRLILGSASPRRLALLAQIGVAPSEVRPADIDEAPAKGEQPRPYCRRMAREKATAVPLGPNEAILTADTTVAVGRRILGKPGDEDEARAFLALLSGRRHKVFTALALRTHARLWERDCVTTLRMKRLERAEVDAYLATGDWRGKAGGYGIQGPAAAFVPWLQGSYTGVVGLPLAETAGLLRAAGLLA